MKKIDTYMMATKANTKLEDVSSETPDLCHVHEEHNDYYIGQWISARGFMATKFPKETTRELTEEEVEEYSKSYIWMDGKPTRLLCGNLKEM